MADNINMDDPRERENQAKLKNKVAAGAQKTGKHLLFPTAFYEMKLDPDTLKKSRDRILKMRDDDKEAYHNKDIIWVSNDNLHGHKDFKDLNDYLKFVAGTILQDQAIDADHNKVYTTGMWANVSKKWYQHQSHNHPNSWYSAIVYLDSPKGCGRTTFDDPRVQRQIHQPDYLGLSLENAFQFTVQPEPGKVVFFPSYIKHAVNPGMQDEGEDRITIAANFHYHGQAQRLTQKWKW